MYYPIISVIMAPTSNSEHLSSAINSVLKQSYPHWELLLIHNGIDTTFNKTIRQYTMQDKRIRSCTLSSSLQEQQSPAAFYIEGLHNAKGEWICFLAEEDMYTQDRFATLIEQTFTRPDIKMFHTSYIVRDEINSTILGISFPEDATDTRLFSPLSFMRNTSFSLSSIFIRKDACTPLPSIPKNIKYAYLFSLFMSISQYAKTGYINTITCHHRITSYQNLSLGKEHETDKKISTGINAIAPYDIQFDTGTMCITMLHEHSIKELTPYLSSDNIDIYKTFISSVLSTALSPHSSIYACGVTPILLERLLEWLTNDSPEHFRKTLHEHTSALILSDFSSIPSVLQEVCSKIIHKTTGSYTFSPEPLRVILARSGADILRTNPSIAMLYMSYCQKTFPDIYSSMLIYFHDAPVQNTNTVLQRPIPIALEGAQQAVQQSIPQ